MTSPLSMSVLRWSFLALGGSLLAGNAAAQDKAKPPATVRSPSALSVRTQVEVENISSLIEALRTYAGRNNGQYPAKIEDLVTRRILSEADFKKFVTSPLDLGGLQTNGYDFYLAGKDINSPPSEVLIIGKNLLAPADSRRAVGLQDGSVTWWKRPQVEAFLKAVKKAK